MYQPPPPYKSLKITPVTAMIEIKMFAYLAQCTTSYENQIMRSCTMASLAFCLNETLVQQSQEEAE